MAQSPVLVSVVVPTYNERENLARLAFRLFATLNPHTTELLIIDDDSPDGTAQAVQELAAKYPIRCIVRRAERGLATAVIAGLRAARGEHIVVMDADLSHPPESIPALLAPLSDRRVQMVIGSRFVPGGSIDRHWPLARRLNSRVARLLARPLTPVRDMMSGFFAVRRPDLHLEELRPVGYKIALELIVRHGWRNVVEVPIAFSERAAGCSKLDVREQLRYLRHLARLYGHAFFRRGSAGIPPGSGLAGRAAGSERRQHTDNPGARQA
jgi:dolichol-phosphate mannosyltransferase